MGGIKIDQKAGLIANREIMKKAADGTPIEQVRKEVTQELIHDGILSRKTKGMSGNMAQPSIIRENVLNFQQVFEERGLSELEPYRVLMDGMMSATQTRKRTITEVIEHQNADGTPAPSEVKYRDIYEEVPDWYVRKEIARTILSLCGADPRLINRIEVNGQTGTVNVHIGNLYAEIGKLNPADAVTAYNDLKEMEQRGEVTLLPNGDELYPPATAPIGAPTESVETDILTNLEGVMNVAKVISSK